MNRAQRRSFFSLAAKAQAIVPVAACMNLLKNPVRLTESDVAQANKYGLYQENTRP